jgi:hypothetical protein
MDEFLLPVSPKQAQTIYKALLYAAERSSKLSTEANSLGVREAIAPLNTSHDEFHNTAGHVYKSLQGFLHAPQPKYPEAVASNVVPHAY